MSPAPLSRLTRIDLAVLAAILATGVFVGSVVVRLPSSVGSLRDDGIYLTTAKALAEGHGYRHLQLPGEPQQTKYPILYPLVLAAVWRFFPEFPANLPAVQIVNVVFWTGGSCTAYLLMRRLWRLPWWLPAGGVILAFANLSTVRMLETAMSEPLYLLLTMAALAAAGYEPTARNGDAPKRAGVVRAACTGLLASAAYLTRTIGLTLAMAIVVTWLLQRRWKPAATAAVVTVLAVGSWQVWRIHAGASNVASPASAAFHFDLDYSTWVTHDPAAIARVAYFNTSAVALRLLTMPTQLPETWCATLLESKSFATVLLWLGILVAAGLIVGGFVGTWRRSQPATHLYLLVYLGLVLCWPFIPGRFLVPILPLLTTFLLAGVYMLVRFVAALVSPSPAGQDSPAPTPAPAQIGTPARWSSALPGASAAARIVILLVLLVAYQSGSALAKYPGRPELQEPQRRRESLVKLLLRRTPPEAVICAGENGYLCLRTGRKAIPALPFDDPRPFHYPDDREFFQCGARPTSGSTAAAQREMNTRLLSYLQTAGATHLVEDEVIRPLFTEFRRGHPGAFRLVASAETYSLYEAVRSSR